MKIGFYIAHQRSRPNSAVNKDGRETPLRQTPTSRYVLQCLYMYGNLQRFHLGFLCLIGSSLRLLSIWLILFTYIHVCLYHTCIAYVHV